MNSDEPAGITQSEVQLFIIDRYGPKLNSPDNLKKLLIYMRLNS
jgi:hypothetical protein